MFKRFPYSILIFLFSIFLSHTVDAQTPTDSLNKTLPSYTKIVNNFYRDIGAESRLYRGSEYEFYNRDIRGNAYFMDADIWVKGSVFYDGYLYENVNMRYDLVKNLVVILSYDNFSNIGLLTEKIESFNLLNSHFVNIASPGDAHSAIKPGFYEELYNGKIKVFAKRLKIIQVDPGVTLTVGYYFAPYTVYYVLKDGKYHEFKDAGAIKGILKDKKNQVEQYIKDNKIYFEKNDERKMIDLAKYYDTLTE